MSHTDKNLFTCARISIALPYVFEGDMTTTSLSVIVELSRIADWNDFAHHLIMVCKATCPKDAKPVTVSEFVDWWGRAGEADVNA